MFVSLGKSLKNKWKFQTIHIFYLSIALKFRNLYIWYHITFHLYIFKIWIFLCSSVENPRISSSKLTPWWIDCHVRRDLASTTKRQEVGLPLPWADHCPMRVCSKWVESTMINTLVISAEPDGKLYTTGKLAPKTSLKNMSSQFPHWG